MEPHPTFSALEWFKLERHGWLALVLLDRTTDDFSHVLHKAVIIDGREYLCRGVERFMHNKPWHEGERIGILIEGDPKPPPAASSACPPDAEPAATSSDAEPPQPAEP